MYVDAKPRCFFFLFVRLYIFTFLWAVWGVKWWVWCYFTLLLLSTNPMRRPKHTIVCFGAYQFTKPMERHQSLKLFKNKSLINTLKRLGMILLLQLRLKVHLSWTIFCCGLIHIWCPIVNIKAAGWWWNWNYSALVIIMNGRVSWYNSVCFIAFEQ